MTDVAQDYSRNFTPKFFDRMKRPFNWYKLDNAASIFSMLSSDKSPSIFRMSCTLKQRINVKDLQTALNRIMVRFPYFDVHLRTGVFNYYWEKNPNDPKIVAESKYPCQKLPIYDRGVFPFRVRAYFNRVAVEFHHSLTDGTGAITFLKALVAEYLHLRGVDSNDWEDIFRINQTPDPSEYDYAYKKNYRKENPSTKTKSVAFKPPFTHEKKRVFHVTTGIMSVSDLLKVSREKKVTMTDLLTTIYLDSLQTILFSLPADIQKNHMKPIRIAVPVNLRKIFPTKTMRNFTFMIAPEVDPRLGWHSFNEVLSQVHHSMRKEIGKKQLNQHISQNVRSEQFPIIRTAPLFVKQLIAGFLYNRFGEQQFSGKLSNMGKVTMPKEFSDEIENFELVLAPSTNITSSCAVVSFGDKLVINFGRTVKESTVEKLFFRNLNELGLKIKIETN
ncbi:MAG: hypothetical protein HZR80_11150 [Candidatus Heimdallarchaeota archaeon]